MESEILSTYDRCMQDPKRRSKFEEEYRKLVLVEILIPILEKSEISVRTLAKAAGISPTIIQDIKSGNKEGISYSTFLSILEALGYKASIHITKKRESKVKSRSQKIKHRFLLSRKKNLSLKRRKIFQ